VIAGIIQETPTPKGGRFYMHTTRFTTISKLFERTEAMKKSRFSEEQIIGM
jgi:hypothetical protein